MTSRAVWIASAGTQAGAIRSRPDHGQHLPPLEQMLVEAARDALAPDGASVVVDALHVATMGIRTPGDGGRMHVGHLGPWLPHAIGLRGSPPPVFTWLDTSDAGAAALQRAISDVAAGRATTALVVAGEQMFPTGHVHPDDQASELRRAVLELFAGTLHRPALDPAAARLRTAAAPALHRGEPLDAGALLAMLGRTDRDHLLAAWRSTRDRTAIQDAIRAVVAPSDAAHGLTMIHVGDLLLDAIVRRAGVPADHMQHVLATVALRKNRDARGWPRGYMPSVGRREGHTLDHAAYDAEPRVTPWFRRFDVGAPANAAVAVVLTADPGVATTLAAGGPVLRVETTGEGHAPHALTDRRGFDGLIAALSSAWGGLTATLRPAAVAPGAHTVAWLHDAFPSIELAWLAVAAQAAGHALDGHAAWTRHVLEPYLDGRANPTGGLCAHGHALGASGLLQVAQALHVAQRAPQYVDASALSEAAVRIAPGARVVTTSVGAALTHGRAMAFEVCHVDRQRAPRTTAPASPAAGQSTTPHTAAATDATPHPSHDTAPAVLGTTTGRTGPLTLVSDAAGTRWVHGAG